MKIRITKVFRYQADARRVKELKPGIHDVSKHVAELAIKLRKAELVVEKVVEKVAPENKVVKAAESKKKVARKPVRRSRARSESDE